MRPPPYAAVLIAMLACETDPVNSAVDGADGACTEDTGQSCSPLYSPEFSEIYARTLSQKCALAGGACHAAEGAAGGVVFASEQASYDLLLGNSGAPARIIASEPACSTLMHRIDTTDPAQAMPPGAMLSDAERCSIRQWIAEGAKR